VVIKHRAKGRNQKSLLILGCRFLDCHALRACNDCILGMRNTTLGNIVNEKSKMLLREMQ